ncbi:MULTISPECIES: class II fumarate hydratase [Caldilinea]|jgi:fumarate hydratase class II|uniref:Fumarate hydratase class II n=1 Tax=Caldilinea aerophila (strain DSM 14535 / JCM 11387 / NBRC 104270 / STL-6-O1) TaxID=926550 RepID=I0HZP1_CALAS|nr:MULTISPECIES: class II fumarate hydratase [Caldilinea]MBO9392393.1 class II fumarate hydratase [Caldilinea sp.]BAL98478.1 fumarate hydratase class II [Caldilinea aerophila DSM 14535 = NBRC 104270]GIV74941.1 MAG: fumarate hydratase class II [Caldilinea sp.]
MTEQAYRIERDSMGEVKVPANALYGAQTQRAVENFPISDLRFPRTFIRALGLIKGAAAAVNHDLGLMEADMAEAIQAAAREVAEGKYDDQFVLDIFQTGSGTSTNMNANEVLATLATARLGRKVHPNDHINMSQSSNDVIPTAIHVSAYLAVHDELLPALAHLHQTLLTKAAATDHIVTTGRTHLMDAMPVRMGQIIGGWASQIRHGIERIQSSLPRLAELAQGGTAVGTGINAHPEFGRRIAAKLAEWTGLPFVTSSNYFESLSTQDAAVELSGQLNTVAVSLTKISNDLRWMNSGPIAGLGEISLPALQPGSSIMPGKVNPVIPEAVLMVCAQVMGNHVTITLGGQSGNFQLNVMLPVIAYNLLQSISLLANASRVLADKAIAGFTVNEERIASLVGRNPILVTALNPVIGYEKGARIAKRAYAEGRSLKEVALEETDLSPEELDRILDPRALTEGGIHE